MAIFYCKSTSEGEQIEDKNPAKAAYTFVNHMLKGMYKFKLKKVTAGKAKEEPDMTITVSDTNAKEYYFQYTSLKNR